MKNYYKLTLLAVVILLGTAGLNAQNRYTFGDGKTYSTTIVASDNLQIIQTDEKTANCSFGKEGKHPERTNAVTHMLTVNVTGGVPSEIHVASGDSYHNYATYGSSLSDVVEEGYYDIMVVGSFYEYGEGYKGIITYDQIPVFEDVIFEASFNDCVYLVAIDAVNENGQSLLELDYVSCDYLVNFVWENGTWSIVDMPMDCPYLTELPGKLRFSGFDERSKLFLTANIHTANQIVYNIVFPTICGLSDNVAFHNEAVELILHEEKIHLNDYDTAYYHMDSYTIYDDTRWISSFSYSKELTFDPALPITVISNNKISDPSAYTDIPQIILYPAIFESYPNNSSWPYYENLIVPFGLYYNNENQLVSEPFGRRYDVIVSYTMQDYMGFFPQTPALTVNNPANTLFFGERTPISYYQAYSVKASQSLSGQNSFRPSVYSIGENGCQRIGDKSAIAVVRYNGEEIFNDSLYKWPGYQEFQSEEAGMVMMDINNAHLTVDGVEKFNQTYIEFDFNKEDVTAPTLTILQVKDENGHESLELPNIASSYINFAAGDFSPHYTETGGYAHFDYMQYDGKPNIEVYCSYLGEWLPLQFVEKGEMFHESYGNYFTIDLSQLPAEASDNWISLEFVLTDDDGNLMQQELSNLFYVGHLESVNELTSLTHAVYPNPFSGEVKIAAAQNVNGVANIAVYNVLGEQVYSKIENCTETKEFTIDGGTWKAGVYFYSISTKDGLLQGKIVKV